MIERSGLRDFGLRSRLVRCVSFVLIVELGCDVLNMLNRVGKIGLGWEVVLVVLLFLSRRRSIQPAKPHFGLKYSTCSNPRRNAPIDCCMGVMVFDIERRLKEGGLVVMGVRSLPRPKFGSVISFANLDMLLPLFVRVIKW